MTRYTEKIVLSEITADGLLD